MTTGRTLICFILTALVMPRLCLGKDKPKALDYFKEAQGNSLLVREGYDRCHRYVDAWLEFARDEVGPVKTMLISERAVGKHMRDVWNPRNAAADNYAFMVLSTSFTDPEKFQGIMKTILKNERRYASLPDGMPVIYNIEKDQQIGEADVFGASEYVKDGLMAITEWMGADNPWFDRMIEIQSLMWSKYATVKTASGEWMISDNVEVNGEQLQMLPRLYWITGDKKWLEYAIRLADHYLLGGGNHPTDDFTVLRFRDHGNEILGGLTELYATLTFVNPAKAKAYKAQLYKIYDRALQVGRNEDGFFYNSVNPKSGKILDNKLADNFGYVLNGYYTLYMVDGKVEYRDATRQVLENIHPKYLNNDFGEAMDGRTDSAEGVMNLYNREPIEDAALWVDDTMQDLWIQQNENGLISGIYPDGNFARTTIMYCLWKSQGITIRPYDKNVAFGAVERDGTVYISISSEQAYEGRLVFDQPRSKTIMHMPLDWPRINQFPEWFTVKADTNYVVQDMATGENQSYTGKALHEGLQVTLAAGAVKQIRIGQK